jgi:hypothetical protein
VTPDDIAWPCSPCRRASLRENEYRGHPGAAVALLHVGWQSPQVQLIDCQQFAPSATGQPHRDCIHCQQPRLHGRLWARCFRRALHRSNNHCQSKVQESWFGVRDIEGERDRERRPRSGQEPAQLLRRPYCGGRRFLRRAAKQTASRDSRNTPGLYSYGIFADGPVSIDVCSLTDSVCKHYH